jgi:hypothetical protein
MFGSQYHKPTDPSRPHILTYLLTPWSRVLLEKLTVNFAASQEIPRIYGTRKFLTVPHLTFLELQNSTYRFRHPIFFHNLTLEIMALHRNVMKDDILCELYVDMYSDVSHDRKIKILDIDSNVPPHSC